MGLPARTLDRYTYADYAAWPEDARHELIHGEAVIAPFDVLLDAPVLVVEVLSPSSVIHDTVVKFRLNAEHGVPEYWIVNPDARRLHQFVLEDGRYVERASLGAGESLACVAVPGIVLDGDRFFEGIA